MEQVKLLPLCKPPIVSEHPKSVFGHTHVHGPFVVTRIWDHYPKGRVYMKL